MILTCSQFCAYAALANDSVALEKSLPDMNVSTPTAILITKILHHHPSITAAKLAIASADQAITTAWWGYAPTPSFSVEQLGSRRSYVGRLEQPLWTGGKISSQIALNEALKKESIETYDEARYALAQRVLEIFGNIRQVQGRINVHKEALDQLHEYHRMIINRIEGGVSAQSDLQLIKTRIAQSENDLLVAKTSLATLSGQLYILSQGQVKLNDMVVTEAEIERLSKDEVVSQAFATYPTLRKMTAKVETARVAIEQAQSQFYPTLSLRAERQVGGTLGIDYNDNRLYIAASMSPGAGLSTFSKIAEAQTKLLEAQQQYDTEKLSLDEKISNDFESYRSLDDRMVTAQKAIEASHEVLSSYTRLFIAGKRSWLDVVNAAREQTQNQIAASDLLSSRYVYALRLQLYQGKLISPVGQP